MYHGHGGGMSKETGPASWFIVSKKESYMIEKWKEMCDQYWKTHNSPHTYFWMDGLFRFLFENDSLFQQLWLKSPYLYCDLDGQSHSLCFHGMEKNSPSLKKLFETKPPYALKFWSKWSHFFPDTTTESCINSNGYCAIQLSKRKYCFKHTMT
jgi:hypothetical protein